MKLGVREICEVVFKAKTAQKIGNKVFYKNEPVIYFDTLKTSSLEGQSTTVYATGGRGNARLMGWDGERTVTFTMEDALISPEGMSILMGAGLVQGQSEKPVIVHTTERTDNWTLTGSGDSQVLSVTLTHLPYIGKIPKVGTGQNADTNTLLAGVDNDQDYIYIMAVQDDDIISEPFIPSEVSVAKGSADGTFVIECKKKGTSGSSSGDSDDQIRQNDFSVFEKNKTTVLVDYYVAHESTDAFEVTIRPDQFGCNFYVEASTLFRDTNGVDLPAEFIIPNAKVQSNFTFSMASSGDPSTFTFTMDAFPDYTRWDKQHKVIAALQVISLGDTLEKLDRLGTPHDGVVYDKDGNPETKVAAVKTDYDNKHKGYIEY